MWMCHLLIFNHVLQQFKHHHLLSGCIMSGGAHDPCVAGERNLLGTWTTSQSSQCSSLLHHWTSILSGGALGLHWMEIHATFSSNFSSSWRCSSVPVSLRFFLQSGQLHDHQCKRRRQNSPSPSRSPADGVVIAPSSPPSLPICITVCTCFWLLYSLSTVMTCALLSACFHDA